MLELIEQFIFVMGCVQKIFNFGYDRSKCLDVTKSFMLVDQRSIFSWIPVPVSKHS